MGGYPALKSDMIEKTRGTNEANSETTDSDSDGDGPSNGGQVTPMQEIWQGYCRISPAVGLLKGLAWLIGFTLPPWVPVGILAVPLVCAALEYLNRGY